MIAVNVQHLWEAADVDAALHDDGEDAGDHDEGLQHVRPDDGTKAALRNSTERYRFKVAFRLKRTFAVAIRIGVTTETMQLHTINRGTVKMNMTNN